MVPKVYGIGNPLIDIITQITEENLVLLGIHKGTMSDKQVGAVSNGTVERILIPC